MATIQAINTAMVDSPSHPIIIDGLDECRDESMRGDVLEAIADAASKLPDSIKIILTS